MGTDNGREPAARRSGPARSGIGGDPRRRQGGIPAQRALGTLLTGTNIQVEGIKTLLTDIGIAMIASFLGVMFTAISTQLFLEHV